MLQGASWAVNQALGKGETTQSPRADPAFCAKEAGDRSGPMPFPCLAKKEGGAVGLGNAKAALGMPGAAVGRCARRAGSGKSMLGYFSSCSISPGEARNISTKD